MAKYSERIIEADKKIIQGFCSDDRDDWPVGETKALKVNYLAVVDAASEWMADHITGRPQFKSSDELITSILKLEKTLQKIEGLEFHER